MNLPSNCKMHGYTPYIMLLQPGATYNKKYHIGFPFSIHGGRMQHFYKSCLVIVTVGFGSANLKQVSLIPGPLSIICTFYSSTKMHWYTS